VAPVRLVLETLVAIQNRAQRRGVSAPNIRAALAAVGADDLSSMSDSLMSPAQPSDLDIVRAAMVPAKDQHIANAGFAHFAEDDFGG